MPPEAAEVRAWLQKADRDRRTAELALVTERDAASLDHRDAVKPLTAYA